MPPPLWGLGMLPAAAWPCVCDECSSWQAAEIGSLAAGGCSSPLQALAMLTYAVRNCEQAKELKVVGRVA